MELNAEVAVPAPSPVRRGRPRRVPVAEGAENSIPRARRGRRPRVAAAPAGSVVEEIVSRVETLVADNDRLRRENAALHDTLTQLTEALSGIAPRRRGRPRRSVV
ncbi:MAG TPA: hypothetical protein VNN74_03520 [Candidatus Micrarchaeia archaeon]|nr:hypothetical protein [Candidatus Micrarchaeia archaeon]